MTPRALLMVAADPEVLRGLAGQFPRAQWRPMAARAAAQVQAALQTRPPEVALIHQEVEGERGESLCAALRAALPEVTLILLTTGFPNNRGPQDPWDAAIRHPTPPGVLPDLVLAQLRARAARQLQLTPFLAEIKARADRMDAQTYAQLLELPDPYQPQDVRAAYDRMSLQFHPDRHLPLKGAHPAEFGALNDLYKRIGEAYRVLSDPEKSARYQKQRAQGELRYNEAERRVGPASLEDLSENPRVKRFLKLAQSSKDSGNLRAALQNLRFAQSMDRDNAELSTYIDQLQAQLDAAP
jgi:hypothetical protein